MHIKLENSSENLELLNNHTKFLTQQLKRKYSINNVCYLPQTLLPIKFLS